VGAEMKRLFWIFILISLLGNGILAKSWNGIVPCVSTRSEVEKILGKDTVRHSDPVGTYRFKRSTIYVDYSRRGAPANDIVRSMNVIPDQSKTILLTKFAKNIPDFPKGFLKRVMDPNRTHIGYLAHYINADEGFDIVVQKNEDGVEIVDSFFYYGLDSDCSK
jgi:hypothetical protein